jgi:hypothetical protein
MGEDCRMRKLSIIAVLVFAAFAGCGKKDKLDQAISDFEGWKSKMCACKDAACAEKTHEDYKKWEDEMEKSMGDMDKDKIDKSKLEKLEKIEGEMKDCRRKLRAPDPAPPAPAGDTPPATP